MFPPFETETWPASRPLTEWLLRLTPEGGTSYFGLGQSSVSERGYQIMRVAGIQPTSADPAVCLGSPDLLVSARRRRIIELRDRHRGAVSEQRRA